MTESNKHQIPIPIKYRTYLCGTTTPKHVTRS